MPDSAATPGFPRLTYLRIKNYRALHDVELRDLTPLTVFIGPNGSGKSTVLDALAFLAEAVSGNLQQAWEKRNRFAGMRTRGQDGPIEFEVGVVSTDQLLEFRYLLIINGNEEEITTFHEQLSELDGLLTTLLFETTLDQGGGSITFNVPSLSELDKEEVYTDSEPKWRRSGHIRMLGFNGPLLKVLSAMVPVTFGYALIPLIDLLTSYRYIHLTDDHLKGYSDAGPREKLSANGDNLPNVLYYLYTKHPEALARISEKLRQWVPWLTDIVPEITSDERLLLRFRDAGFEKPMPTQYMSGGTMKLAVLLTLLYEPNATGLVGIEEPENELHPRLLLRVAEELVKATEMRQLLVATHSPFLLDALEPEQVWILHRGEDGYTQSIRLADMPDVVAMVEEGSKLGYLWARNFFDVGDPLAWFPTYRKQE